MQDARHATTRSRCYRSVYGRSCSNGTRTRQHGCTTRTCEKLSRADTRCIRKFRVVFQMPASKWSGRSDTNDSRRGSLKSLPRARGPTLCLHTWPETVYFLLIGFVKFIANSIGIKRSPTAPVAPRVGTSGVMMMQVNPQTCRPGIGSRPISPTFLQNTAQQSAS